MTFDQWPYGVGEFPSRMDYRNPHNIGDSGGTVLCPVTGPDVVKLAEAINRLAAAMEAQQKPRKLKK